MGSLLMANKNAIKKRCNSTICDAMEKVFIFDNSGGALERHDLHQPHLS
jgi:hypothetical protein